MDVKKKLLNKYLDETIYMAQPTSYVVKGKEQKVCKLLRSIYGLKDQRNKMIALSQASYIDKVLEHFVMTDSKPGVQPTPSGFHLSLDDYPKTAKEREHMSKVSYALAVGSLMYVMLCTRSDICFTVGMVSLYQTNHVSNIGKL
ncbi:hypothetical protein CXB51_005851 [Gossypium anomalum]|uniref:Reverse transcriptase Ty1/copia-type domain-containing protein n=1 Tax=Gossypium anomalum TaxID=47600 RepID=A0A8J5ZG36_9ROSI|nr:hypothetical protein CXB51_005851 [Gossypium anomalum]